MDFKWNMQNINKLNKKKEATKLYRNKNAIHLYQYIFIKFDFAYLLFPYIQQNLNIELKKARHELSQNADKIKETGKV